MALDKIYQLEQTISAGNIEVDSELKQEIQMAKAFIYEIFIDFGQIKFSKDSQELFFQ